MWERFCKRWCLCFKLKTHGPHHKCYIDSFSRRFVQSDSRYRCPFSLVRLLPGNTIRFESDFRDTYAPVLCRRRCFGGSLGLNLYTLHYSSSLSPSRALFIFSTRGSEEGHPYPSPHSHTPHHRCEDCPTRKCGARQHSGTWGTADKQEGNSVSTGSYEKATALRYYWGKNERMQYIETTWQFDVWMTAAL